MLSPSNRHCNVSANNLFGKETFHILFYNIRGLLSHSTELMAVVRISKIPPALICLNETFLDESVEDVVLEGYSIVARRDRSDGRKCGGVAVYALDSIARRVTLVEKSKSCERVWLVLHTDTGPYLLGDWYRPPQPGDISSIEACEEEWERLSTETLGTILIGDVNVHHVSWLRHSSRNSAEGVKLRDFSQRVGLRQIDTNLQEESICLIWHSQI